MLARFPTCDSIEALNPTASGAVAGPISNEEFKKRMAILDKSWADCSVEEKLEKELVQLGNMSWSINNLQNEITKLREHDHKDGKLVIPLNGSALNAIGSSVGLASRRNNLA
jgi:hypothetical protein